MSIGEAVSRARECPCEKCEAWAKELEKMYIKRKERRFNYWVVESDGKITEDESLNE